MLKAPKPPKMTAQKMELLLSQHFGMRENIIVPNVSWGLLNHEADLLVLRPSGWAEEVEIKVSKQDIKRDAQKHGGRGHRSSELVHKLWFAVPEALADTPEIPAHAGILAAVWNEQRCYWTMETVRAPVINKGSRKLLPDEVQQLMRLGMFRIWTLKEKLLSMRNSFDTLHAKQEELENGLARTQRESREGRELGVDGV